MKLGALVYGDSDGPTKKAGMAALRLLSGWTQRVLLFLAFRTAGLLTNQGLSESSAWRIESVVQRHLSDFQTKNAVLSALVELIFDNL